MLDSLRQNKRRRLLPRLVLGGALVAALALGLWLALMPVAPTANAATFAAPREVAVNSIAATDAISGLAAANSSPTLVNHSTSFTATITGGTVLTYTWDYGDGSDGSGITSTHTYTEGGIYTATVTAENITDTESATTTVIVQEPLTDVDPSNDGPAEVGEDVNFTATVTGGDNNNFISWDYGDGHSSPASEPGLHAYEEAGTYTATVTAQNGVSLVTDTTTVYIGDAVVEVSNNQFTPKGVTIPSGGTVVWQRVEGDHSVTADDNSFEQLASNSWDVFSHTFTYTVAITVPYYCTNHGAPGGIGMSGVITVEAPPPPIDALTADNDSPKEVGDPVAFTTVITGGGSDIDYDWTFGDGAAGTGITATHSYTQAGVYTATVVASNATNEVTATTKVYIGDAVVEVDDFQYTPKNVTIEPGGTVVWVLKGGNHSVTADDLSFNQPQGTDWPPFVHTFTGTVAAATLGATNDTVIPYHCTVHASMTGTVTLAAAPDPITDLDAVNTGPKTVGQTVIFTALVSSGTAISYTWDFDDGSTGSGRTATHAYTQTGIYTATVVASNATNSMTDTTTVYIGDVIVEVSNTQFTPKNVTIPVGGTVVWMRTGGAHSVTADNGSFEQPFSGDWTSFAHTFNAPGFNRYYCTQHGAPGGGGMSGTVTVTEDQQQLLLPNVKLRD